MKEFCFCYLLPKKLVHLWIKTENEEKGKEQFLVWLLAEHRVKGDLKEIKTDFCSYEEKQGKLSVNNLPFIIILTKL